MLLFRRPTENQVRAFLAAQREAPFSYTEVGASKTAAPVGYVVDHNRLRLGEGEENFRLAIRALQGWQMFNLGWVQLFFSDTPILAGQVVAVLSRHLGFYSLNACRIVYTVDTTGDLNAPVVRYGFAYGTLAEHAERGEERFMVEWCRVDNSVCYDLFAFSRPHHRLAKSGYPLARHLQKRFARDSKQAMFDAVQQSSSRARIG